MSDAIIMAETSHLPQSAWVDHAPHRDGYVEANGIRLNYLDWGGDGPPIVMIHGIADSPHSFDDLAPLLSDKFRVLAYARRGHGHSDAPKGPYDAAALTADLAGFLNALGIQRASLLGWSMGGDEITEFAGRYPDRVDKLIYLEGGYDWADPAFFKPFADILAINSPEPAVLNSLDTLRSWYSAAWVGKGISWTDGLEAFLRDATRIKPDGAVGPVPSLDVFTALLQTLGTWRRDYTKVRAPALALYATEFFSTNRSDPALAGKLRAFEEGTMGPFRRASMERIHRELANVTVRQIDNRTHMSIGVVELGVLAELIREFLLAPARPDSK